MALSFGGVGGGFGWRRRRSRCSTQGGMRASICRRRRRSTYAHSLVDHAVEYVNGRIHTDGSENSWSRLKREIVETYVSVEPFHLSRYFDDQSCRDNSTIGTIGMSARTRFEASMQQVAGKRLTYNHLLGNGSATSHEEATRKRRAQR